MCGLFGVIGPGIIEIDRVVLRDLASVSVVRGADGSGMLQGACYLKHALWEIEKSGNQISYLMWYHDKHKLGNRRLFHDPQANFFCGHVRAATKGTINEANAHPFETKNYIAMHNGTLKECDYRPVGDITDSEMMFRDMDEKGIAPVLRSLHKDSAYAVVIFDKDSQEFTIARNEHRTLFMAWHLHRKVLYYASERMMLDWILSRYDIVKSQIVSVTPHVLHTFNPWDVNSGKAPSWAFTSIKVEKETPKVGNVFQKVAGGPQNNLPFQSWTEQQKAKTGSKVACEEIEEKGKDAEAAEVIDADASLAKKEVEVALPKNFLSPPAKKVFKIDSLYKKCVGCDRELSKLEQYQGEEISKDEYMCLPCCNLYHGVKSDYSVN